MTDNHKVSGHRHSTALILIVIAALLVGLFALGMLTFAPRSTLTMILVTASGVVLIAFVVGIVVQEVRAHRAKRSD